MVIGISIVGTRAFWNWIIAMVLGSGLSNNLYWSDIFLWPIEAAGPRGRWTVMSSGGQCQTSIVHPSTGVGVSGVNGNSARKLAVAARACAIGDVIDPNRICRAGRARARTRQWENVMNINVDSCRLRRQRLFVGYYRAGHTTWWLRSATDYRCLATGQPWIWSRSTRRKLNSVGSIMVNRCLSRWYTTIMDAL